MSAERKCSTNGTPRMLNGFLRRLAFVAITALAPLAFSHLADAHGRDAVPDEPEALAQYRAGLAAYYNNDYAAALEAWGPIAERRSGSSAAQLFLGFIHAAGLGVEQDFAIAAKWYRRAAEQDLALAQIRLAMAYRRGEGVERDPVQAYAWAALAAREEGHLQGFAGALREALAQEMTPEQVAQAKRLVADLAAAHRDGE
jgi:TPR repeat protein